MENPNFISLSDALNSHCPLKVYIPHIDSSVKFNDKLEFVSDESNADVAVYRKEGENTSLPLITRGSLMLYMNKLNPEDATKVNGVGDIVNAIISGDFSTATTLWNAMLGTGWFGVNLYNNTLVISLFDYALCNKDNNPLYNTSIVFLYLLSGRSPKTTRPTLFAEILSDKNKSMKNRLPLDPKKMIDCIKENMDSVGRFVGSFIKHCVTSEDYTTSDELYKIFLEWNKL